MKKHFNSYSYFTLFFAFLILFFFSSTLLAQQNTIETTLPKSKIKIASYAELPIKKKLAAIADKDILIFLGQDQTIWLAKMKAGTWEAFQIAEKFTTERIVHVEEKNIDNKGNFEILIDWEFMGKQDFLNVIVKGIQIWNIDEQIAYLDEIYLAHEERYNPDTGIHYYGGCIRQIQHQNFQLSISPFECNLELGYEVLPENIISGSFQFYNGKFYAQ